MTTDRLSNFEKKPSVRKASVVGVRGKEGSAEDGEQ